MTSIVEYMTLQHRFCDDSFAAAEASVSTNNWSEASKQWEIFSRVHETHLLNEENILFPEFEHVSGNPSGPTTVMRMEHKQMRDMMTLMATCLQEKDAERYLDLSETLMILIQQHNLKEEEILYPMTQRLLEDCTDVMDKMSDLRIE